MSSLLNDLRQFRLQKNKMPSGDDKDSESNSKPELVPGRKRVQTLPSSDSEDHDTPQKVIKIQLTTNEKEKRFLAALKLAPDYDTMDLQDALVRNNWDVSAAIKYLKEHYPKKGNRTTNGVSNHTKKIKRKRPSYFSDDDDDDDDSDGNNMARQDNRVYDSDSDSDIEVTRSMSSSRKAVFEFMNKASVIELLCVKSLSEKKANAIIELRPFENWEDLARKLENSKSLSGDILNNTQELLLKQNNVAAIMEKCNKMVKNLEGAISEGCGITEQPKSLNPAFKLADYQLIGLNWLAVMHKLKMNGILADEMGLGKTIQVIAFLAYLKENNLAKHAHLVVVPSSTLDNWEQEFKKWAPDLVLEKYYGNQEERRAMRAKFVNAGFTGFDVLLTTYHMVQSGPEEQKMFKICKLHYVIFDEAHMLKNMTTQRYSQLININAEMRILLTGTPLQNNLLELMSLLCFVMPSFFAKNKEDIKSLFSNKQKVKTDEQKTNTFETTQVEKAKSIMKPFVLRRVKADVLKNLPTKTEHVKKVPMTETQSVQYQQLCDYYRNDENEITGTQETAGCAIMMEMRKLANHPLLLRHYFDDEEVKEIAIKLTKSQTFKVKNPDHAFEDIAWMSDFQIYQTCEKHGIYDVTIPNDLILNSGKFRELDSLLPKLKKDGHRVLIFSQFTMMLDIAEKYLSIRKHRYLRLDGQTLVTERQELIDKFNNDSDIFCFLLSTKAGGMGINLTAADTCIIHDIDFNPYNDKQAEDRCHRMGQSKSVDVYRLISIGTIEEAMHHIGNEKLKLEQQLSGRENGKQELKNMVRLLTMALGMNEQKAETLLSPELNKNLKTNRRIQKEIEEF
ncbi:SWI/SNF-related matrix-associated actin-dependent regulator of chromatin subfamily A containing DEAD/H box 1 homolog [Condylostylus longicornis]|uniref:SWI/SNF-related matrix-associated actin-dependent regulator of chromatin subfamily A containing DEAD/H box 1 homolog n=1 Tax=Condylostylus longicornis TaxID=2530218 RepID=UPI00244E563B|nr:SWI/SNF-related matrix-associated actin-dependent regulator of chromatin subfamily A containing DEAD/H box 1 homolog [Condylostylus longicornis]